MDLTNGVRPLMPLLLLVALTPTHVTIPDRYQAMAYEPANPTTSTTPLGIHVARAHPRASDGNKGTRERPLETIGEALRRAVKKSRQGLSVRVSVHPGTYREELLLTNDHPDRPHAPILIEGTGPGSSIVSGSDVWTGGWQTDAGLWWRPWPHRWGPVPYPTGWENSYASDHLRANPVLRRREMIFVAGELLVQEMSMNELRAEEGSFFVDESQGRVYMHLPAGVSPNRDRVEVAVRATALHVHDQGGVTLKDLVFQHAASQLENKAVLFRNANGTSIIGSVFRWNNWTGLAIEESTDVRVVGSSANHNGNAGMTGQFLSGFDVLESEMSFNGWRSSRGVDREQASMAVDKNLLDFAGGHKFFHLRDALFDGVTADSNQGSGLWLDYDNSDVVISDSQFSDNWTQGIHVEAGKGPISVGKTVMCGNETGILINNASDVKVSFSTLANNHLGQLWQAGVNEPRPVYNAYEDRWEETQSTDWTLLGNNVRTAPGQRAIGTYVTSAWDSFVRTLTSDLNRWTFEDTPAIFQVGGGELLDFAGWQTHTSEDARSLSLQEPAACSAPPRRG